MLLESYKKQDKENKDRIAAEQAKENPPEPKRKTLVEILADKKESVMLGGFLEADGVSDVALRLMNGDLQDGDMAILETYRVNNIEKVHQVETLETAITADYVKELALQSPEFQKVVNLVGPEKAAAAFKSQLREVVVSDPSRFASMHDTLQKISSFKSGEMKQLEDSIKEQCSKIKLSEDIFVTTMAIEDDIEREESLRKNVRSSYGLFKKAGDFLTQGKWSKADALELAKNKSEMDRVIAELNENIANMGNTLSSVANGNESIRKAFANEIIGEKTPQKVDTDTGFNEARTEIKNEKTTIATEWSRFKTSSNFDGASQQDQDYLRRQFRNELKQKEYQKNVKKGLWAKILSALFDKKVNDAELK